MAVICQFIAFFLVVFMFSSQGDSRLLDPTLLAQELETFANDGLGVKEMQFEFDLLQFTQQTVDGASLVSTVADKVGTKFKERLSVVKKLKTAAEASYARSQSSSSQWQCCKTYDTSNNLEYDYRFRQKIDLTKGCIAISGSAPSNHRYLNDTFVDDMKQILLDHPFIKWQYFGSEEGVLINFPAFQLSDDCSRYDPRFRPWYVETATSEPKDVVLVIDTSGSMIGNRIKVAKDAAVTVLKTMNPRDRIGVVSFSSIAETPGSSSDDGKFCYSEGLADATPINLDYLQNYVEYLYAEGGTQYGNAFIKAFELLKGSGSSLQDNFRRKKVILFLTDGKPNDDKGRIMQIIKDKNVEQSNSVIIMTYGMLVYAPILLDIANQDGTSYGVSKEPGVTSGKFTSISDTNNLRSAMATYYDFFSRNAEKDRPIISVPYVDAFGIGLLTTVSLPCYHDGKFIGVVGTDLSMEDLLSEITYFRSGQASYAFMADNSGRAMMHPLLPSPSNTDDDPIFMDIRDLEPAPSFTSEVFESMKRGGSGQTSFVSKRYLARGGNVYEGVTVVKLNSTYFWRPVEKTNFTVGIVVAVDDKSEILQKQSVPSDFQFLYHRLDLIKPSSPCVNFARYAVNGTTIVKFGPDAFNDPYRYLSLEETVSQVNSYNAYMTGKRDENPGFKDGVRGSVVTTKKVEDIWFKLTKKYSQYLVWRYIGTSNGVFRLTPGVILDKSYDPSKRPWYHTALSNTGLVALSTPYIDAFGAGVVITAAHTVYRGESEHKHGTSDEVIGVMGADFPLSYFQKLLTDTYPLCEDSKYSCFVIDKAGFLIMHEDFLAPDITAATLEYVHITQKEKDVAEDLLLNGYMLTKQCRNLEKIKTENFYQLKLPLEGVDTIRYGERCKKYQISSIAGSNAFIGIIFQESGCSSRSCTCSSTKKCLNVQGLSCQCPCSTRLDFLYCRSEFPPSNISNCPVPAAVLSSNQVNDPSTKNLEKCFDPECSKKLSSDSCDGVVGCYWCVRDKNGVPLDEEYCADINACYGGKEGTRAPGSPGQDPDVDDTHSPNLPHKDIRIIAEVIVVVALVVVVGVGVGVFLRKICKRRARHRAPAARRARRPPPSAPRQELAAASNPAFENHYTHPPPTNPRYA